ncbi:histone-lysine N-methyltransferase SETMAR [Trichonephila clavipes]|nr:histone-lysine N-methyltransferase SETMAR [Trichonephila clavipes]
MTLLSAQVEANPCQTIEELPNALNQSWSTIQEHLQHIGKTNKAGVWVPHNLSEENRDNRSATCNLLLQRYNAEPFFDRLITADEKWALYDNLKRQRQWLSPNEPPRRTTKPGLHPKKKRCAFGGVFVESSILKCLNLEKLLMQTFIVNN